MGNGAARAFDIAGARPGSPHSDNAFELFERSSSEPARAASPPRAAIDRATAMAPHKVRKHSMSDPSLAKIGRIWRHGKGGSGRTGRPRAFALREASRVRRGADPHGLQTTTSC